MGEKVCVCGHRDGMHYGRDGRCAGDDGRCGCALWRVWQFNGTRFESSVVIPIRLK